MSVIKENRKIIDQFIKLIEQINYDLNKSETNEKRNRNMFRLRQMKNVLRILKGYKKVIRRGEDLKDIKGIGKGTIVRINEILEKGYLKEIKVLSKKSKLNKYVNDLQKVIGIGKTTAIELVNRGITSVKQLKSMYKKGEIELNDKILLGLKYYGKYDENIPRKEIDKMEIYLQKIIDKVSGRLHGIICGSYRRGKKVSHDIDLLITHPNIKKMSDIKEDKNNYLIRLVKLLKSDGFLVDDMTDKHIKTKYMGFSKLGKKYPIRRFDIRYVPYESYYSALLYFTGSGDFNKVMRVNAIKKGYKLNEYGIYKIKEKDDGRLVFKRIKIGSEKDIFDILDMKYVEPRKR